MYRTNANYTHYLFLKHAPLKNYTAPQFINHVAYLVQKYSITGGIVHLGCGSSHKLNDNGRNSIVQFNSCRVHNHVKHGLQTALVRAEQTMVQTSVFTHRPVSIISAHESELSQDEDSDNDSDNDSDTLVNEDLFLIFMISNQTRIPCACLMQIISHNETRDEVKYTKMIQYFMRNALNATHHTTHPRNVLPFFSEVPMIRNSVLN